MLMCLINLEYKYWGPILKKNKFQKVIIPKIFISKGHYSEDFNSEESFYSEFWNNNPSG